MLSKLNWFISQNSLDDSLICSWHFLKATSNEYHAFLHFRGILLYFLLFITSIWILLSSKNRWTCCPYFAFCFFCLSVLSEISNNICSFASGKKSIFHHILFQQKKGSCHLNAKIHIEFDFFQFVVSNLIKIWFMDIWIHLKSVFEQMFFSLYSFDPSLKELQDWQKAALRLDRQGFHISLLCKCSVHLCHDIQFWKSSRSNLSAYSTCHIH